MLSCSIVHSWKQFQLSEVEVIARSDAKTSTPSETRQLSSEGGVFETSSPSFISESKMQKKNAPWPMK